MKKWKTCTLADLGEIVGGATPSTKDESNYGGTVPWITPKDLSQLSGRYIFRGERCITDKGLRSCSTQLLPANSILFSSRAPIGYVAISGQPVCTNQGFKSIVPNEQTDAMFLYYLLCYKRAAIESLGSGTTFKEVSGSTMRGVSVRVPEDISVQRAIANILNSLDSKIECNSKINDNLQQQAFAVFDNLLKDKQKATVPLSSVADLNPKRDLGKSVSARCIDMARLSTSGSFPDGWDIKPYNGGMKFRNGDTLLARITPCLENGKTAFIDFLDDGEVAFGSTEYIVMCPKGNLPPEFLYCLARYPSFVDYAVKNMNGSSGRQRVSAETIGKYEIPLLSEDDMEPFVSTVPGLFRAMRNNAFENMRLADLRDALLPRLMSGDIDVSAIDV